MIVKEFGHDKVKQSPQLCHRVLDRRARQQKPVTRVELEEHFPATTQVILDGLGLVENHVVPFDLKELGLVLRVIRNQVVRGDQHVDLHGRVGQVLRVEELAELLTLLCVAPVW